MSLYNTNDWASIHNGGCPAPKAADAAACDLGPEFAVAGEAASAMLSPDGTRIVYTGGGTDGKVRLYSRLLDQEQAEPLAGTEDAYGPFFSTAGSSSGSSRPAS